MTKWFSQLWCRLPLTYNASLGEWQSGEGGREREKTHLQCSVHTAVPPQTAPILGLMCGMHSFWVQFGYQRERKREQVCVRLRVCVGGSDCLFSHPLFESIVFRQLRFFMRRTIWRVLSECRAAAVFWGTSFMDHRPGVGRWIQTHPPSSHPYLLL